MTIVVNAVGIKMGGGANDLASLLRQLLRQPPRHRFVFFLAQELADVARELPASIDCRLVPPSPGSWLGRTWWDQVTLRRWLKRERAEVLFSFSDYGMLRCPVRQLLFVRNSIVFSDLFRQHVLPRKSWWFRLLYRLRRWLVCRSIRAADAVLAPSASMLAMIQHATALPDGRAGVNYLGAPDYQAEAAAEREYGGPVRLLFPTYYADHKDFGTALRALRLLRHRHGSRFRLVTTADPNWHLARSVAARDDDLALLDQLCRQGAVEVLGLLPHPELLAFYRKCHVMCYTSLAESFGHPLVEAMQAGLPIVASELPVNRELARDAALYFEPGNAEQLAARLEAILFQPDLRRQLQGRGQRYAREFSWARHTEELLRRLEALAEGEP